MRTFFAIPIAPFGQKFSAVQTALDGVPGVRVVPPDHLHLTLRFIGETAEQQLPRLSEGLTDIAGRLHRFPLTCRGLGCFPNTRRPRVVWAGVEPHDSMFTLASDLETMCRELGFEADRLPFKPHITLARIRSNRGRESSAEAMNTIARLVESHAGTPFFSLEAAEVTLFRSELTPSGVTYSPLATAVFGG